MEKGRVFFTFIPNDSITHLETHGLGVKPLRLFVVLNKINDMTQTILTSPITGNAAVGSEWQLLADRAIKNLSGHRAHRVFESVTSRHPPLLAEGPR